MAECQLTERRFSLHDLSERELLYILQGVNAQMCDAYDNRQSSAFGELKKLKETIEAAVMPAGEPKQRQEA